MVPSRRKEKSVHDSAYPSSNGKPESGGVGRSDWRSAGRNRAESEAGRSCRNSEKRWKLPAGWRRGGVVRAVEDDVDDDGRLSLVPLGFHRPDRDGRKDRIQKAGPPLTRLSLAVWPRAFDGSCHSADQSSDVQPTLQSTQRNVANKPRRSVRPTYTSGVGLIIWASHRASVVRFYSTTRSVRLTLGLHPAGQTRARRL